jgi:hypothetical protein
MSLFDQQDGKDQADKNAPVDSGSKAKAKSKEDIHPEYAKAPDEHTEREGASRFSGFQPPERFSSQGSTKNETQATTQQRAGLKTVERTDQHQDDHFFQARRDSLKD